MDNQHYALAFILLFAGCIGVCGLVTLGLVVWECFRGDPSD